MNSPVLPHDGRLVELLAPPEREPALRREAMHLPGWELAPRQLCDLESLLTGAFSPLAGFMERADYESVLERMRLAEGALWPIPVVLDVDEEFARRLGNGARIALCDPEGAPLAVLAVNDLWRPDRRREARCVFGTGEETHPGVDALLRRTHPVYVGGRLEGIELPAHFDFRSLRFTPRALRAAFARRGWRRIAGYQAPYPIQREHVELAFRAAREADAGLLIHPLAGLTTPGDIDSYSQVRCGQRVLQSYPEENAMLALLPLSMRMGGPREAFWHAIIRKNYGCTHFIVDRDHAGAGNGPQGTPFYPPYAAQELCRAHERELGIGILSFPEGPERASYPEVAAEPARTRPPKQRQGVVVFFTGLSGAGKSTIARALLAKLLEIGGRSVTLLDGDIVRKHLSSELGFSHAHRDLNILRIGFVASEIAKHGGIALCAPIAPYHEARHRVRGMVTEHGGFIEVYVSTPIEVCEARDRKGMYAKARAGLIKGFTGVDDPYEIPQDAELTIDTRDCTPVEAAGLVVARLAAEGYIRRLV